GLNLLSGGDKHGGDGAVSFGADLMENLHGLDDAKRCPCRHRLSRSTKLGGVRGSPQVDDPEQRRDNLQASLLRHRVAMDVCRPGSPFRRSRVARAWG